MSGSDATEQEHQTPEPRSHKWRALWLLGAFVVLLLGAFLLFRLLTARQIAGELDDIRAAGYPATAEELDDWYADVPDDENAARVLGKAFREIRQPGAEAKKKLPVMGELELPPPDEPLKPETLAAIHKLLTRNEEALRLLHDGAAMERARWPVDLGRGIAAQFDHLSKLREAASLLTLDGVAHAEAGRPKAAADSLEAVLGLAESLKNEPVLVSQFVRSAIQALGVYTLVRVVNRTTLKDDDLADLMAALAEAEKPSAILKGMVGERASTTHTFRSAYTSKLSPRMAAYRAIGLLDLDHALYLDLMEKMVAASKLPTHKRHATFKKLSRQIENLPFYALVTNITTQSLTRAVLIDLRAIAQLRTARVALAVQRYRLAHGDLPDKLTDLTPRVIQKLPPDPFTGKPLHYKNTSRSFTVYSVGEDTTDHGGARENAKGNEFEPGSDIPFTISDF